MLVRCKAKFGPIAFATTDEYQNEDLFRQQEDYWKDYWKDSVHPPGHTLKRRRTLVDVAYVWFTKDGIKPISKKIYIYPREQLSPLSQTDIEELYARFEPGNGNIKVSRVGSNSLEHARGTPFSPLA